MPNVLDTEPMDFAYEQVDGQKIPFILTSHYERSDCCGVKACVMVEFKPDEILFFCHHHYKKHEDALFISASYIRDETLSLITNRLIGSDK